MRDKRLQKKQRNFAWINVHSDGRTTRKHNTNNELLHWRHKKRTITNIYIYLYRMPTYQRERGLDLHNQTVGDLPDQLVQRDDMLQYVAQQLLLTWAWGKPKVWIWWIPSKTLCFQHTWEGHTCGLSMHRIRLRR